MAVPFVDLSLQHHSLHSEIEQALEQVVQRGDFILGQAVRDFEQAFAHLCGTCYGIGVASGTDAITLGLQACGIGNGDEVLVPANTFIATILGIQKTGATPVFVDCDPATALMDLAKADQALTPQTRAIVPVHLYGQMVSPSQLLDFAQTYNLLIFEDAAQAHGATREGYRAGSIGTAAAFSFYPSKNLGSMGNGGIVVTSEEAVAQKVKVLRNYGAPHKYFHTDVGTNSRLDTLQAAVLQVKLPYLQQWNQQRYEAAQIYDRLLANHETIVPIENQGGSGHVYHLYVVRLTDSQFASQSTLLGEPPLLATDPRSQLQHTLVTQGIQTGIHYPVPCHLQPALHYLGYRPSTFPYSELLSQTILSLPMYPGLEVSQIQSVVSVLVDAVTSPQ
jgi:dTDP-4-amino-4,6-dideoxygalactose transaminase